MVNAYAAEHLEIQTEDAAALAARVRNAGAIFVGSFAPVSLGDYCAGSNHVLPTAGCACHSSGLSVRSFLKAVHVVDYTREAPRRGRRPRGHPRRRRGPARPRRRRARAVRAGLTSMTFPPLREELRGIAPYGAPQLDVPVQLNVNENPYAPSPAVVADVATAVAEVDRHAEPLPRPGVHRAAHGPGRLPRPRGASPEQVWAANGSNEIMLQLLQAFGGPGRTALSFAPTYSMYPEYARDTVTDWVVGHRESDFTLDLDRARDLVGERRPSVVLLPSPNNPTGTALPPEAVSDAVRGGRRDGHSGLVVVDEAYGEFRRRDAQRAGAARRSTATWSSPAR